MSLHPAAARIRGAGTAVLRYGLVLILLLIGAMKFTPAEAAAIHPWVANSPFLAWLYTLTSEQGASMLIGAVEIVVALLIALRRWSPAAAAIGSLAAAAMFVVTLSFLFTTPNQSPDAQGFLMKDVFLLGAALWSAGEALDAHA
jgi:uncharacterized membrane protein YkgB